MPVSAEPERGRPRRRLANLVRSFLGVPRPAHYKNQQELNDELLPWFVEYARLSWLLAEPHSLNLDCAYNALAKETGENGPNRITRLRDVLEEMRVFELLEAAAASPDVGALINRRSTYEVQLLNQCGHPRAFDEFEDLLRRVTADPEMLANARQTLDEAANKTKAVSGDIAILPPHVKQGSILHPSPPADDQQLPKKRKLFTGLGSIFAGTVLLAGNGVATPTVVITPPVALGLLSSFSGGIAAVGKGIGDLRGEGG
jgi:hypothetical protein